MPEIVVKVDLQCSRCDTKIRKVLDCIKEGKEFPIESIKYDEKNNKVFIKGPFDAEKLIERLCCMAGKIIKCIVILPPPPKKPSPPPSPPPKPACKLVPFPYPYPCRYPPWPCRGSCDDCGSGGCRCCAKPPPPSPPPPPCRCCEDGHGGHGDCRCSVKQPPWPPVPYCPPPPPWCEYKYLCEDNPGACSVM